MDLRLSPRYSPLQLLVRRGNGFEGIYFSIRPQFIEVERSLSDVSADVEYNARLKLRDQPLQIIIEIQPERGCSTVDAQPKCGFHALLQIMHERHLSPDTKSTLRRHTPGTRHSLHPMPVRWAVFSPRPRTVDGLINLPIVS